MKTRSIMFLMFVSATLANIGFAATDKATELGYSSEIINEVRLINDKSHKNEIDVNLSEKENSKIYSESDAVQEQLTELGYTRGLISCQPSNTREVRSDVLEYWSRNGIKNKEIIPLDPALAASVESNIKNALNNNGYSIIKFELLPTVFPNIMRGDIRVVRAIKSKYAYNEIQENLAQVKDICLKAATIGTTCHLSEMTTFIVENPRNNYYYEKTILHP
ncbi:MAG: hypothetical protein PHF29_05090 [Candidatus Riflebacteria bacterium]|nr:hypothetical protein [Candidatus Riflebacteria bacterium]